MRRAIQRRAQGLRVNLRRRPVFQQARARQRAGLEIHDGRQRQQVWRVDFATPDFAQGAARLAQAFRRAQTSPARVRKRASDAEGGDAMERGARADDAPRQGPGIGRSRDMVLQQHIAQRIDPDREIRAAQMPPQRRRDVRRRRRRRDFNDMKGVAGRGAALEQAARGVVEIVALSGCAATGRVSASGAIAVAASAATLRLSLSRLRARVRNSK